MRLDAERERRASQRCSPSVPLGFAVESAPSTPVPTGVTTWPRSRSALVSDDRIAASSSTSTTLAMRKG